MNIFRMKINSYWEKSERQRQEQAVKSISFYQRRIDLKNAKILEIGCGNGDYSIELARTGAFVVSIDIDPGRTQLVRMRAKEEGVNLNVFVGDAQETPFKAESYDLILCRHVIEHVSNPELLIEEMSRILKQGGAIQLTAPNRYSISQIFRDEHYRLPLVIILPRKLASFLVCKIFKLEDEYSVSIIPSYRLLKKWTKTRGLMMQMDLPNREWIKEKLIHPERINNRIYRLILKTASLLFFNRVIAKLVCTERITGFFATGWSLWITKQKV